MKERGNEKEKKVGKVKNMKRNKKRESKNEKEKRRGDGEGEGEDGGEKRRRRRRKERMMKKKKVAPSHYKSPQVPGPSSSERDLRPRLSSAVDTLGFRSRRTPRSSTPGWAIARRRRSFRPPARR